MSLPSSVKIIEVGPRDGLQNEPDRIPTADKIHFIDLLAKANLRNIEVTSFVHPKAVPQLADAADVLAALALAGPVRYSALVPNARGLARAIDSGVQHIAVFTAASESFNQNNIKMGIAESLEVFRPVIAEALQAGLSVRGYVSTCFVCPFEGRVDRTVVRDLTAQLIEMGVHEVAISDTVGAAVPTDVFDTVGHVIEQVPVEQLALHMHDTYGTALANVLAGLQLGIATYDGSTGGLGGCPYAPGASGNLATEDLVYMLHGMGIDTGVDFDRLIDAGMFISGVIGRQLSSRQLVRCHDA